MSSTTVENNSISDNENELIEEHNETHTKKLKEPVPDTGEEDIAENKTDFEYYDELSKKINEISSQMTKQLASLKQFKKELDKHHYKIAREAKKKIKRVNPNKQSAGFEKPTLIPEKFLNFINNGIENNGFTDEKMTELQEKNLNSESLIPRSFVTRIVYDYIKHKKLYKDTDKDGTKDNKRCINPDETIKELFSMKDTEDLDFFNFQTYVCKLFPKKNKNEDNNEVEQTENNESEDLNLEGNNEDEEDEEEPEPEPVKTKSKSKSKSKQSSSSI